MSEPVRYDRRRSDREPADDVTLAMLAERLRAVMHSLDALREDVTTRLAHVETMLRGNGDGLAMRVATIERWMNRIVSVHTWVMKAAITLGVAGVGGAIVWLAKRGAFG